MKEGFFRDHSYLVIAAFALIDGILLLSSAVLAHYFYFGTFELPYAYKMTMVTSFLLCAWLFPFMGVYDMRRGEGVLTEIQTVLTAWVSVLVVLLLIGALTKTNWQMSRLWVAVWFAVGAAATVCFRIAIWRALDKLRANGYNLSHIIVIGHGQLAKTVVEKIRAEAWMGLNVTGYFSDSSEENLLQSVDNCSCLGKLSDLAAYIHKNHVDEVWIVLPLSQGEDLKLTMNGLKFAMNQIRLVPDTLGFQIINNSTTQIAGIPVINIAETPMHGIFQLLKLIEDKLISAIILLLISPIMIVIAILVKFSSPGPVFYRQERVSMNGKTFEMLKFRSMPVDTESKSGPTWASKGEVRATWVGQFLRSTSLDELPQFINVLKGDMSIVGPRPERPIFVERFKDEIPGYMQKHLVKAGITGWAQVNGWRGDTSLKERINHDLYYIRNWSILFDLKIIFLTLFKGFVHQNAY